MPILLKGVIRRNRRCLGEYGSYAQMTSREPGADCRHRPLIEFSPRALTVASHPPIGGQRNLVKSHKLCHLPVDSFTRAELVEAAEESSPRMVRSGHVETLARTQRRFREKLSGCDRRYNDVDGSQPGPAHDSGPSSPEGSAPDEVHVHHRGVYVLAVIRRCSLISYFLIKTEKFRQPG